MYKVNYFLDKGKKHEASKICDLCGKAYFAERDLKRHMFTAHGEGEDTTGTYTCDRCEKTYNSEGSLRNHIKTFHEGLRRAQCQQCGKGFLSKNDLNRHVLAIHEGVKVRFFLKFGF